MVRGASGTEIDRIAVTPSTDPIEWAGVGADGDPLPEGTYAFELESYVGGELAGTSIVQGYAEITEAKIAGGQTVLVLPGGLEIPASAVISVRAG